MYDFDQDNKISKDDIRCLLSHAPLESNKITLIIPGLTPTPINADEYGNVPYDGSDDSDRKESEE